MGGNKYHLENSQIDDKKSPQTHRKSEPDVNISGQNYLHPSHSMHFIRNFEPSEENKVQVVLINSVEKI